jgi:gamma-glutamyltranspeptidase/glutathione hydrolase
MRQMAQIQQAVLNYRDAYFNSSQGAQEADVKRLLQWAKAGDWQTGLTSPSTIHTSAVDSNGLACAITASAGYGSGVMVTGTGLWLNNSLGEIELHPQGVQGLTSGTRLVSNMAPTIARHGDGTVLAIGSPGASRITTAIVQVLYHFLHQDTSLAEAINCPRMHVEVWEGKPSIAFEAGFPVETTEGFGVREFPPLSMYFGGVHGVRWHPNQGLVAAADPRRAGGVAYGGEG